MSIAQYLPVSMTNSLESTKQLLRSWEHLLNRYARPVVQSLTQSTDVFDMSSSDPTGEDYISPDTTILRITNGADTASWQGIAVPEHAWRIIRLVIVDGEVELRHQAAGAAAATRIICPAALDFVLDADDVCDLQYDSTSQRWRVVNLVQ